MRNLTQVALTILATFVASSAFAQCPNSGGYSNYQLNSPNSDVSYNQGFRGFPQGPRVRSSTPSTSYSQGYDTTYPSQQQYGQYGMDQSNFQDSMTSYDQPYMSNMPSYNQSYQSNQPYMSNMPSYNQSYQSSQPYQSNMSSYDQSYQSNQPSSQGYDSSKSNSGSNYSNSSQNNAGYYNPRATQDNTAKSTTNGVSSPTNTTTK